MWNFIQMLNNKIYTSPLNLAKYVYKWQNYVVWTKTTPISQRSSVMQKWLKTNGFIENNESLPKFSRFELAITSGAPCWKSIINSSRSLRRLMSWKSPCRPSGESCHKNTLTRRWQTSAASYMAVTANDGHSEQLRASAVVTLSVSKIASTSHHQQKRLFPEPLIASEDNAGNAGKWGVLS